MKAYNRMVLQRGSVHCLYLSFLLAVFLGWLSASCHAEGIVNFRNLRTVPPGKTIPKSEKSPILEVNYSGVPNKAGGSGNLFLTIVVFNKDGKQESATVVGAIGTSSDRTGLLNMSSDTFYCRPMATVVWGKKPKEWLFARSALFRQLNTTISGHSKQTWLPPIELVPAIDIAAKWRDGGLSLGWSLAENTAFSYVRLWLVGTSEMKDGIKGGQESLHVPLQYLILGTFLKGNKIQLSQKELLSKMQFLETTQGQKLTEFRKDKDLADIFRLALFAQVSVFDKEHHLLNESPVIVCGPAPTE